MGWALLVSGLLGSVLSCGDSSTAPIDTQLLIAPQQIELTEAHSIDTVFLSATPQNARLEWRIAAKPDWVTLTPEAGAIQGDIVEIQIAAPQLATMEPGSMYGTIEFIANGGQAALPISAVVQPNPVLKLSSSSVTVPATSDTALVTVSNTGRGQLYWSAVSSTSVVTVPSNGTLATGEAVAVKIVANKEPLPAGTATAQVTFSSNQAAGDVTLPVSIIVPPSPVAVLSTSRLVFPSGVTSRTIWLRNSGKGALHWSASASAAWGTVSPAEGTLAVADSAELTVAVDRAAAGSSDVASTLTVASDAVNGAQSARLEVTGAAGLSLGLTVLDYHVVDAEYSAASGYLVAVSASPDQLAIIDVETGRTATVPLSLPPACVAIQPDGRYAAVCHNGYVSYVDLQSKQVARTYAVTTDALDAVLPGNGWVYVFPRRDQWESIRNIDLATGIETSAGTIYAGALGRLDHTGTAIYVPTMGLSPSSVDKFDISKGVVRGLWSSPYWGEHAYGNLWLGENGERMYASSGEVFWASSSRTQDMYYAGSLAGSGLVYGATDSELRARAYVVRADGSHGMRVYDTQYLAFKGVVPLPTFSSPGGPIAADGRFVFANPSGERVYVLEKADPSGGLAKDWGLAVLDAEALP